MKPDLHDLDEELANSNGFFARREPGGAPELELVTAEVPHPLGRRYVGRPAGSDAESCLERFYFEE